MLTLVIPTRDRAPLLGRLLSYCASQGLRYPILIGDSSHPKDFERTATVVGRLSSSLTIQHLRFPTYEGTAPGDGTIQCMNGLLSLVKTKYTLFVGDDDFAVPGALEQAVEFLEESPDYGAVIGEAGFFTTTDGAHGKINRLWRYPQFSFAEPTGRQRLLSYLTRSITTEHAVKRTDQIRPQWEAARALRMDNRFGELLVASLTVLQGKVKKLNRLFMIRQSHERMISRQNAVINELDYVADPQFAQRYQRYRDCVADELSQTDGMPLKEAKDVVKEGFWWHLSCGLRRKWKVFYGDPNGSESRSPFHTAGRPIPFLQKWGWASRYGADFLSIYRAITTPTSVESVDPQETAECNHLVGIGS